MFNKKLMKRKGSKNITLVWIKRIFSLVLLLILLVLILLGVRNSLTWIKNQFFSDNPKFEILHIDIQTNGNLKNDIIREQLFDIGVTNGSNLFSFDFIDIENKLLNIPHIKSVDIERDLPNALRIKINERHGIGILHQKGRINRPLLIDNEGFIFSGTIQPYKMLPAIVGYRDISRTKKRVYDNDVHLALEIISICNDNAQLRKFITIKEINITNTDYIALSLRNGILIKISRTDLSKKLNDICSVISISNSRGQSINNINAIGSTTIVR